MLFKKSEDVLVDVKGRELLEEAVENAEVKNIQKNRDFLSGEVLLHAKRKELVVHVDAHFVPVSFFWVHF